MAGSPVSVSSSQSSRSTSRPHKQPESIYDYLDALETQSKLQLQSASDSSSSSSSARSRRMLPSRSRDYVWENGANDFAPRSLSGGSPVPSYRSGANSDVSHHYLVGIKEKLAAIAIELNDKTKTIELLKLARKKDKVKTKQLLQAGEAKWQTQLKEQQLKPDKELEKHLDFAQNLVADKAGLAKRCDELLAELQKASATAGREAERFKLQLKDAKDRWTTQEKVQREQWIVKKTEEIKKLTIKALEPNIQAILQKGKADLDKAQDAAADERRKLQTQLEKQHEAVLQRQKDDYERKLVDAREKERAKLMARLDAAGAELQLQLSNQRRRLQEEAETARNELYAELRASKLAQAKELDELAAQEAKRMEAALAKCQKEKEGVVRKCEIEFTALREQASIECEQFKAQLTAKLRREFESDKLAFEKQMLAARDAKIEVVIEKLQESRAMLAKAKHKAVAKFEAEHKEWKRKLKQASEIEGVWMEKDRDLHDKELVRLLHEERRQHEATVKQLEHCCATAQQDSEHSRQHMSAELTTLREKMETMAENFQTQMQKIQRDHDAELANLHERVRSTIARKDQVIENTQEELHLMQAKLSKSHALIEEQRMQLFGE